MSTTSRSQLPAGLPPGPDLPRARQTTRWMARPAHFLRSLQERHGDVFTIHLLNEEPWVVVSDPELVKQIFTASPDVLHAGEPKHILEPLLGPESVLLTDGERHMRERKLLLPPFHASRLARYEEAMRAVAAAEVDRWPTGTPAAAAPRTHAIALEVILRTVFGADEDGLLAPLRQAVEGLVEYLSDNARTLLVALGDEGRLREGRFAGLGAAIARADEAIFAELARRRAAAAAEDGDDVLSMLLAARHDDGSPMSYGELRDQLMSLLIAGHETTAASLSWALEQLVHNPAALERTVAEAPGGGGPYTDAVIRETLRLRPPFMHLARRVKQPFRLRDHVLPEEVTVAVAIPLVHRRPDVYPDPESFRPERFLERPPGTYTWIPFGGGVRRCIGAGFSLLEMRVVLSTLLARATVRAAEDEPEMASRRLLVLAPSRGTRIVLKPR